MSLTPRPDALRVFASRVRYRSAAFRRRPATAVQFCAPDQPALVRRLLHSSGRDAIAGTCRQPSRGSPDTPHCAADPATGVPVRRRRPPVLVLVGVVAWLAVGPAGVAMAQPGHLAAAGPVVLALADSIDTVLNNIRNWLIGILAALATVFATVGGVRYVLAGGDPGEVERAKGALRSAAFGYALALLAPLMITVLKGLVGA